MSATCRRCGRNAATSEFFEWSPEGAILSFLQTICLCGEASQRRIETVAVNPLFLGAAD